MLLLPERQRKRAIFLAVALLVVGSVATWGVYQLTKARRFETESGGAERAGGPSEASASPTSRESVVESGTRVAALDEEAAEAKRRAAAAADEAAAALAAAEAAQRRGNQSASAAANAPPARRGRGGGGARSSRPGAVGSAGQRRHPRRRCRTP